MKTPKSQLLFLLADLARQPDLRRRFLRDPRAVLREYDISPREEADLRSRDPVRLHAALNHEAEALVRSLMTPRTVQIPWPDAQPSIDSCDPPSGGVGAPIPFTIEGMFFFGTCSLSFVSPSGTVVATDVRVKCDPDTGDSSLWADATFTNPGVYDVVVTVTDGDESIAVSLSMGFDAQSARAAR